MYSLLVGCSRYWSDVVTHMHESTVHIFVLTQFLKIGPMDKISRAEGKLVCQMAAENACRRLEIGAAQTWHDLFSAFESDNWTWDQLEEEPPWKLQKCIKCLCLVRLGQFEVQATRPCEQRRAFLRHMEPTFPSSFQSIVARSVQRTVGLS